MKKIFIPLLILMSCNHKESLIGKSIPVFNVNSVDTVPLIRFVPEDEPTFFFDSNSQKDNGTIDSTRSSIFEANLVFTNNHGKGFIKIRYGLDSALTIEGDTTQLIKTLIEEFMKTSKDYGKMYQALRILGRDAPILLKKVFDVVNDTSTTKQESGL